MLYRVFLDTNVVLDLVLNREPFRAEAELLFLLHEEERISIYISALTLANIAYIFKLHGKNPADVVDRLMYWVNIIDLKKIHFEKNVRSKFKDFEDGLQFYAASEVEEMDAIITRDRAGFKFSDIPIFTPKEFLNQF